MLEQHRVAAACGVEKGGGEIAVGEQHGNRARQHRKGEQKQKGRHQKRPDEKRHLVHGHARGAHVENGGDEIDCAQNGRQPRDVQRQDGEIHGGARLAACRERRIDRPARPHAVAARRAFHEDRNQQQDERGGQEPERQIVHAWKRHIRRAYHDRHEPIAEAADDGGHHDKKHHDEAVAGHQHIVEMIIAAQNPVARKLQFHADENRHRPADDAADNGENQIERADVLMIGRIEKTPPAGNRVFPVMPRVVCHILRHVLEFLLYGRGMRQLFVCRGGGIFAPRLCDPCIESGAADDLDPYRHEGVPHPA